MKERGLARIHSLYGEASVVPVLLADHARTRSLLRRAWGLARETGPSQGIGDVATELWRFFAYWNPLHEVDEEQSVVPALEAYGPAFDVRATVSRTVTEHQRLDELRDELGRVWSQLAEEPRCLEEVRSDLRRLTKGLVRTLANHCAWEERELFPRVARYVPPEVQARILRVMSARRAAPTEAVAV